MAAALCVSAAAHAGLFGASMDGRPSELTRSLCLMPVFRNRTGDLELVPELFATASPRAQNDGANLFGKPLAGQAARCLGGEAENCRSVGRNLLRAAAADAFRLDAERWFKSGRNDYFNANLSANGFMVQVVTAYGLLRERLALAPLERQEIEAWIARRAEEYQNRWPLDGTPRDGSNIRAANGSLEMVVGVVLGEGARYQRGLAQFRRTMATVLEDGSLPNEARRGEFGIHYTSKTLSHLVFQAEIAAARGESLYGAGHPRDVHAAVRFFLDTMEDARRIEPYAWPGLAPGAPPPKPQDLNFIARLGFVAWFEPYLARFPNHPNAPRIRALAARFQLKKPLRVEDWFGGPASC